MNTLMKSPRFPAFTSLLEDFWGSDFGLRNPFGNSDQLPAVNIKETDQNFEIEVAAPGFHKEDFKVDIDSQRRLTITAESKRETEDEKASFARREFSYSSFTRTFTLPESVKQEDVKAQYQDGVLRLTLTKSAEAQPQRKMISVE